MRYVVIIFIMVIAFRTLTFARTNWNRNNKRAAVGSVTLAVFTLAAPLILMLFGKL